VPFCEGCAGCCSYCVADGLVWCAGMGLDGRKTGATWSWTERASIRSISRPRPSWLTSSSISSLYLKLDYASIHKCFSKCMDPNIIAASWVSRRLRSIPIGHTVTAVIGEAGGSRTP
jgi:hypothetical protein